MRSPKIAFRARKDRIVRSSVFLGVVLFTACSGPGLAPEPAYGEASQEVAAVACASLPSLDCTTPKSAVCESGQPNNCQQPTKLCDPRPRTGRRDANSDCFDVVGTGHVMEDSLGNVIGTLTDTQVHLNYGVRRSDIHSTDKVMVWAAQTTSGVLTGWVNASAIGQDLSFFPKLAPPNPGGTYSTWHVQVSDNSPYVDANGNSYKINPNVCGGGENATDYLGRANGTVNLIWNLPATSPAMGSPTIDVFPNSTRLIFNRAQAQLSVSRPLYQPCSSSPPPSGKAQSLSFLYGYLQTVNGTPRWGWMAMPNLAPGT